MKKIIAAFGLFLSLSACANDPQPVAVQPARIMAPKVALDVQSITLTDRTGLQPANSPYNSNNFSPTISEAIRQWAGDRLQAVGQTGQAIIVIKKATLIAQPIATEEGIDSWFTRQQSVKYVGRAEVSIEANGRPGFAMADASATRSVTLPEDPSPVERQNAYYTLLNGMMRDLGEHLDSSIQNHMAPFIKSAPVLGSTAIPSSMNKAAPSAVQAQPMAVEAANDDSDKGNQPMVVAEETAPNTNVQEMPQQTYATAAAIRDVTPSNNGALFIPLSGPYSNK